jgi:tRNA threonylcarbamoyladenosine biosynthesis protein TsaB
LLAYALGAHVVALDTLEVIAAQASASSDSATAVLDAFRGQVFTADFVRQTDGHMRAVSETQIVDDDTWLANLKPEQTITGPGVGKFDGGLPTTVTVVDPGLWSPTAATVARLGQRQFSAGQRDDVWTLVPKYYRRSAAEEKLDTQSSSPSDKSSA